MMENSGRDQNATDEHFSGSAEDKDQPIRGVDEMESERSEPPTTSKPQLPPRSPAPAVFKAWRQECYGALMTRAVAEDDVETLNWMVEHELVDLAAADELGNTAAHLAVFHDSPSVLRLLHQLGVDLSATCDAKGFGTPIFYSILLGRVECLAELIRLGYDITTSCDGFGRTPAMVAARHDQGDALDAIRRTLAVVEVQRLVRGFLGRRKAIRIGAERGGVTSTLNDADIQGNLRDDMASADCGKVCY